MGTQYAWFYDVIVAAIALVCIFIGSKKGVLKSVFSFVGIMIAAILSYAISGAVSETISNSTVSDSNSKKMLRILDTETFVNDYIDYLEHMGYSIVIKKEKVEAIFQNKEENIGEALAKYINNINGHPVDEKDVLIEKIREGYAIIIKDLVSQSLNKYAAETAIQQIREDSSGMQELIPMIMESDRLSPATDYIAEKYIAPAYYTITRLISFIVMFVFIALLLVFSANAYFGRREASAIGVTSHVAGGIFGLITSIFIIFAVAVCIRIGAITGNNEMLFFNNEAVDRSYAFKYFYDFASKM
ncbi:MAG: hypothetical protein IKK66_05170 [Ruminococcus sp.]|nr:hypothetical protein [Ruminococcus sp.]